MSSYEGDPQGKDILAGELTDFCFEIGLDDMMEDFRQLNDEIRSHTAGVRRKILRKFEGRVQSITNPNAIAVHLGFDKASSFDHDKDEGVNCSFILPSEISPDQASDLELTVLDLVLRQAMVYCAAHAAEQGASNEATRIKMNDPITAFAFIRHPRMAHTSLIQSIRNTFPKEENGYIDPSASRATLGQSVLSIQRAVNRKIIIPIEISTEQLLPICLRNAAETLANR